MTPQCFCCGRPAARLDRWLGKWVCEGNSDCRMSLMGRTVTATAPDPRFDFLWEDFEQMFVRSRNVTPCQVAAYKACFYAGAWAAAWRVSTHSPNDAWIQDFMLHLKSTINEHYLNLLELAPAKVQ